MLCSTDMQNFNSKLYSRLRKSNKSDIYNSGQCKISNRQNLSNFVIFVEPRMILGSYFARWLNTTLSTCISKKLLNVNFKF
jgi:hypothetical protein